MGRTWKETEEFTNSLNGDLQGIGAELSVDDGQIVVVNPLKDSPAEKAGIKPGDVIYKIGDESKIIMNQCEPFVFRSISHCVLIPIERY